MANDICSMRDIAQAFNRIPYTLRPTPKIKPHT